MSTTSSSDVMSSWRSDEDVGDDTEEEEFYRIGISWSGLLEPVDVSPQTQLEELARFIQSANDCQFPQHKLFIFKGMLLPDDMSLKEAGVRDGSVLHLVLDDCPYQGRPLHINCDGNNLKTIFCGADFYIEDVKEDLSFFLDQPPPEKHSLLFAGRELQNYHTLREYNIQKESVLLSVKRESGRHVQNFVYSVWPEANRCDAPVDVIIQLRFCPEDMNNGHFWGSMLGGPDTDTIDSTVFVVRACTDQGWTKLSGIIQINGRVVSFLPSRPLRPATRYEVTLHGWTGEAAAARAAGRSSLLHSRVPERVVGDYTWSFSTVGYEPLRVLAVYPRPHSRVRCGAASVAVRFSRPLSARDRRAAADWVTVRGHALLPPAYDADACALVYAFAEPPQPGEICRARIDSERVRGAAGESLLPAQPDGLLRTSTFRWKFYTDAASQYERENLAASGVAIVLARHAAGKLRPLGGAADAEGAPGKAAAAPTAPGGAGVGGGGGGVGEHMGWGVGVPDLRALLRRTESVMSDGSGGGGGGGGADWLNPSLLLAGAVDAFYGEEVAVIQ